MQMMNMIQEKCPKFVQFAWYIWIGENHRLLFSYSIIEHIVLKMTIIIHISGFHLCKMAPLHVWN